MKAIKHISRRKFLSSTGLTTAGLTIVPARTIAGLGYKAPSDTLNIAAIGIGGFGSVNLSAVETENIVALCDVDLDYASRTIDKYYTAKVYQDYRIMFEEQKNIDAVIIATPDHTHALQALIAMQNGYHVYLQQPLAHSIYETRILAETADKYRVATQMGNQGSSGNGVRQLCEWIWSGVIGEIAEVDCYTPQPLWEQALKKPEKSMRVPRNLDWDLFIGPAEYREYHSTYTPYNWRSWFDFGNGALGEAGCHVLDPVFKALKLDSPIAIEGSSTPFNNESFPQAQKITFWFPERDNLPKVSMPPVKINWFDGGLKPERAEELIDGEYKYACIFKGSKGKIACNLFGENPTLLPVNKMASFEQPEKTIHRITNENHEQDWIRACKESPENRLEASSEFSYSGKLSETVLLGVLAIKLQSLNRRLIWDSQNMRFKNISVNDVLNLGSENILIADGKVTSNKNIESIPALTSAAEWIRHTYREGWEQI